MNDIFHSLIHADTVINYIIYYFVLRNLNYCYDLDQLQLNIGFF